jgi:hypothetical protein
MSRKFARQCGESEQVEGGSGMTDQLRELAEADPFKPFVILTLSGNKLRVGSAKDIEFTHYGSLKIWVPDDYKSFDEFKRGHWRILNAAVIAEIVL